MTPFHRTLTLEPRVGGASFATFTYGNNGSFSFTLHNITVCSFFPFFICLRRVHAFC